MPNAAFYKSKPWLEMRAAALKRDGWRCVVSGCGQRATVVDHIVSRKRGGPTALSNLRSLCASHDSQVKESASGKRRSGGAFTVKGCDANGMPVDPNHPWNRQ